MGGKATRSLVSALQLECMLQKKARVSIPKSKERPALEALLPAPFISPSFTQSSQVVFGSREITSTTPHLYFFPYRAFFPRSKGMYLYLIMCLPAVCQPLGRKRASARCLLDLSSHCQAEKGEEVDEQDWPVDWDVGSPGDGTEECDSSGFSCRVPEFEF